jgi:adenine deaminase
MNLPAVIDVFHSIPSSVPSTSQDLETSGGCLDASEVTQLCQRADVIALGEIMNANELFSDGDNRTKRIIAAFRKNKPSCPIEGHCPKIEGELLSRFIRAGVDSDHTEQTAATIRDKTSAGMFIQMQRKSVKQSTIDALRDSPLAGRYCFCTDDVMPDVLVGQGHLDFVLRKAVAFGLPVAEAIYAATYAPAQRMQLYDRGQIAPGRLADFIILDDLESFHIKEVYKNGELVYDAAHGLARRAELPAIDSSTLCSINRKVLTEQDFDLGCPDGTRDILVIEREETTTFTKAAIHPVAVAGGTLDFAAHGLTLVAAVERYGHQSPVRPGFLKNGLSQPGAICSSWSHDSHNLLVMGTSLPLVVRALNMVIERQGGIAMVDDGHELFVPLSYGGIISLRPMEDLARDIQGVRAWLRGHGYRAEEEVMNFAVLTLPVSPALKITDKGLVDVASKRLLDWRTYWLEADRNQQ